MTPQVNIEDAYREAVTALGEAQVRERLFLKHINELQLEIERLTTALTTPQTKKQTKDTSSSE